MSASYFFSTALGDTIFKFFPLSAIDVKGVLRDLVDFPLSAVGEEGSLTLTLKSFSVSSIDFAKVLAFFELLNDWEWTGSFS